MRAAEPVVAAWLAIANMDIHRRMFVRQLANVPGEGMDAAVIGAVMNQIGRKFPVWRPSLAMCVPIAIIGVMPTRRK